MGFNDMMFDPDAFMAGMRTPNRKTREQELAELQRKAQLELQGKKDFAEYQAGLEDRQLTPEMKIFQAYRGDPESWKQYWQDKMPYGDLGMQLRQAALGVQQGQLGLANERFDWQTKEPTDLEKKYNFYKKMGLNDQDALNRASGIKPKPNFSFED